MRRGAVCYFRAYVCGKLRPYGAAGICVAVQAARGGIRAGVRAEMRIKNSERFFSPRRCILARFMV